MISEALKPIRSLNIFTNNKNENKRSQSIFESAVYKRTPVNTKTRDVSIFEQFVYEHKNNS